MKLKPHYPHKSIASIEALSNTLGIHPKLLQELANKIDESYTEFVITSTNSKGEQKSRSVCEPKFYLKKLQKKINSRIFEQVEYPYYLQGGIKDPEYPRDYVANANVHANANQIICVDIKKFYPSIRSKYVKKIFKHFFCFPDDVSEILTKLVTYKNSVPQGGCTSSYVANLIFYESEYLLVSEFKKHGIEYSRLLDDITLSSKNLISKNEEAFAFNKILHMFKKYELHMHNGKKRIEYRSNPKASFEVTGLWIGHKTPKARKVERRFIRQLVFMCEKEYKVTPYTDEYHCRWNEASGKVAKLQRLGHNQSHDLRKRLSLVLPLYNDDMGEKLIHETKKLISLSPKNNNRLGIIKRVNTLINKLGILARNNKSLSKSLRLQINNAYPNKLSKKEIWE
jgi:hypothetical protein